MPKVSIIVPVYNTEQYLERCLNSLVNQTLDDIEILIINDGSIDNSENIAVKYQDMYNSKIHYIKKETNSGLSDTRNIGIENATGEYILFIDSDDFIVQQTCEELYKEASKSKLEVLGYLMYDFTDENNIQFKMLQNSKTPSYTCKTGEEAFYHDWILYNKRDVQACVYMFKREFLINNDLFFLTGVYHEDIDFYFHMITLVKRIGFKNYAYYLRHVRSGSITTSTNKVLIEKRLQDRQNILAGCRTYVEKVSNGRIKIFMNSAIDFLIGPYFNLIVLRPYKKIINKSLIKQLILMNSFKIKGYMFLFYRIRERLSNRE